MDNLGKNWQLIALAGFCFGPRGPKPEEAYIEVPARNMISIYVYIYIYIYIYTVYTRDREI